jgi:general secretion pathway protein G
VTINETNWSVTDTKLTDKNSCLTLEIITLVSGNKSVKVTVDTSKSTGVCKKIQDAGIVTVSYDLY